MGYLRDIDELTESELLRELVVRVERRENGRCDYCNRLRDEGAACKFPERHRRAMSYEERRGG